MTAPDERLGHYPWEDWNRDLDLWFSRMPYPMNDAGPVIRYFKQEYPGNPRQDENCIRLWAALIFLDTKLPRLVEEGAATRGPSGAVTLPYALKSALHRAFLSFEPGVMMKVIDVPLIVKLTKEQREWNEDRRD
jgi:hypothetical protein